MYICKLGTEKEQKQRNLKKKPNNPNQNKTRQLILTTVQHCGKRGRERP